MHADASSLIANPVFLIRRSNTGTTSLRVELSLGQTDTYLDEANPTDVIASGQTEKEVTLPLDYAGNTSGDLTATVVGRSRYAPALAPNNAATVDRSKRRRSGLPLSVALLSRAQYWTVDRGRDSWTRNVDLHRSLRGRGGAKAGQFHRLPGTTEP